MLLFIRNNPFALAVILIGLLCIPDIGKWRKPIKTAMSADQLISKFEIYVKEQEALSQKWKEELDNTEFEQALTIDERLSEMKHCLEKLKELNNEAA